MNYRLPFAVLLLFASLLILPSNKNGRASQVGRGNTGAPGDQTTPSGQPETCINCHNSSAIQATLSIQVLDVNQSPVTQYVPGASYTARVTVNTSSSSVQGYGFQMIALRNQGNADLDGFTDVNPNNYKLATIANGRTYAEHANLSSANTFDVRWTAPAAGTGNVTFYAAGNAVNDNGTSSGDGSGVAQFGLSEAGSVASDEPEWAAAPLQVWPNPMVATGQLRFALRQAGDYQVEAFRADGRLVWATALALPEGTSALDLPAGDWQPGLYWVALRSAAGGQTVKVLKL